MNSVIVVALLCAVPAYGRRHLGESFTIQLDSDGGDTVIQSRHGDEALNRVNKGKICIGTPCQNFTVMFDTGSADLWVASARCQGDACDLFPNKFDYRKSSTYYNNGQRESSTLNYGTGHEKGMDILWSEDRVNVGGVEVPDADVGEVTRANAAIAGAHLDGILGLGFKGLAHHGKTPVFYQMMEDKIVPQNVFTFCKSHNNKISEVTFGSTNSQFYKSSRPVYTKVTKQLHWQFHVNSVKVGGVAIPSCSKQGCEAVADSGTTLIRGPKKIIDQVNKAFGGYYNATSKHYEVDCKTADSLPDVEFVIGGRSFTLDNSRYVFQGDDTCSTAFQVTGSSFENWILGGPFLEGLCTIYDVGKKRIGFATIDDEYNYSSNDYGA